MDLKFDFRKKRILFLSDLHIPYHHPDSLKFLKAMKIKYRPHLVVSVGDLGDFHGISFHKSDPDLMSPGGELKALREVCKQLEKLFPKMIIVGSNHGDLPLRKAFDAGLPKDLIRPFNDIYQVGSGWQFVDDLTLKCNNDIIYVAHYLSKDVAKAAAQRGINIVTGHMHTNFSINYVSNPRNLLWGMSVGCSIDRNSLAFSYNKLDLSRPIIGHGLVDQGQPKLLPMVLDSKHKWNKHVP